MFSRKDNKIINSDGWYVETLGRGAVKYVDDSISVKIGAELLGGEIAYVIFVYDMQVDFFSKTKNLTEDLRTKIVSRVKVAFQAIGSDVDLEYGN